MAEGNPGRLSQANAVSDDEFVEHARYVAFPFRSLGDEWKMKLAIIFQMTYVGSPSIYYGDEVGLTGGTDPDDRRTFNWNSSSWNQNLLTLYETMIKARKPVSAFSDGSFKTLLIDDTNKLYSYGRWDGSIGRLWF